MTNLTITASARGHKDSSGKPKPLCGSDGKALTRVLKRPESPEEITTAFGSLRECVALALTQRKIQLQNEIRLEHASLNGNGPQGKSSKLVSGWKF